MERGATGIVCAGGGSRRMGRDKLALTVGGTPMLHRVCAALGEACDEVIVVSASLETARELEPPSGVRVVSDSRPGTGGSGAGPLAGIEAGLCQAGYTRAFVAAGDMPFVDAGLVAGMLDRLRLGGACAVVPRVGGRPEPLCAAYSGETIRYVSGALDEGVRAVRELVRRLPEVEELTEGEIWRYGEPGLLLMNVNSPEDLAHARRVAGVG